MLVFAGLLLGLWAATGLTASAQALEATEGLQSSGRLVTANCSIFGTPTIEWGDGQTSPGTVEETFFISGTHTYAEEGTFNGSVNYEDDCGSHKVAFQANVADAALSATGTPVSATAGAQVNATVATFTDADPAGVASDYTASIGWGDGTTTAGTVSAASGGGFTVTGSHTYAGGGVYTTNVTINDAGGASGFASSSANVASIIQATEGSQFSAQLATTKCGIFGTPTIEWGDGQTSAATVTSSSISGTHTYAEEGTFNGSVNYEDDCGSHKVAFQANVADAALSATGVPVGAAAGAQFNATVATFTDADPAGFALDYTATIDWGDGTTTSGTVSANLNGGFTVTGPHKYAGSGLYQTSVTISDEGGANATATSSANVVTPTLPSVPPPPAPPTLLTTSPPTVLTTTSAAFTTTVNPQGLPTTVHFEYGPVLGGASAAAITYGSVTPDQPAGSDFANHTATATVTGLLPNVTYHVRAVATNSAGSTQGTDQTLQTPADPPPPPPVLGKSVNVTPVSGIVYVELPPGATLASLATFSPFSTFALAERAFAALTKGQAFIPLTEARQIPVGSILETTHGVVGITAATTASKKGKLQSGDFGAGIFKLLQGRGQKGLTNLDIIDNHSASQVCTTLGKARSATRHPSSKVLGRLNASGHGHFSARGQYSAATVRGTVWSVANQCDGTLTHVKRGVVSVRDFRRRRTFTLFTGQSYLARAPVRRG